MIQNKLFRDCLAAIPAEQKAEFDLSFGIAERISEILKAKGLTQKDFARLLNKRDSEISKWLTGRHNFTTQTISLMRSAIPKDKSNSAFCSAGIAARQSRNNSFCIITLKFQMRL